MFRCLVPLLLLLLMIPSFVFASEKVRIGYFPNITHAQPLVGRSLKLYEKNIKTPIDWKVFNAGPVEMEALLSGHLDIGYVGPNPAINAYLRSKGSALKIIAGAASGGASLVVPRESSAKTPQDFKGKRIASPEYGNTQDVALRSWIKRAGLKPGVDVKITPVKNPDILMLFQQKKIDGAWVPEPWVARLVSEGGGKILLDERTLWKGGMFPTTVVVARKDFIEKNREIVSGFLDAHIETTLWISKNHDAARKRLNNMLAKTLGKPFDDKLLDNALTRVSFIYDPMSAQLLESAKMASELGFLPKRSNNFDLLKGITDLTILNSRLKKFKLSAVRAQ